MPDITITVAQLERLAEKADGLSGEKLMLVVTIDGNIDVAKDNPNDPHRLIGIDTPPIQGRASPLTAIDLTPPPDAKYLFGKGVREAFDALFWSPSAVHKFAVPYYSRLLDSTQLEGLKGAFDDPNVYAVAHYPWTDSVKLQPALVQSESESKTETLKVVSLSEWLATR